MRIPRLVARNAYESGHTPQSGRSRERRSATANPPRELSRSTYDERLAAPGFVDDVRPYLARAAIFVCPMLDGGGTRLKILDALAMGKPVGATELAVEGLDLVDGQHFLRAETPRDFAAQIRRLERDADLRRCLGRQGRSQVERYYSWRAIGKKLERAYRAAASDGE